MEINDSLWVSAHQKELAQYGGKWIAVLDGKILATGGTVKEVMEKVSKKNIRELPLVTKIPRADEGMYVL